MSVESWGRYPKTKESESFLNWRSELPDFTGNTSYLAYGLGRSYGDSCLNDGGEIVHLSGLDKIISFDPDSGVLHAEAGLSLEDIIYFALPKGWFLPVSPGTKFVTIGGAIANDIHGKNHHIAGTFGCHVLELELLRSNGEVLICSESENSEMFAATIAGLGLTGIILAAKIQLKAASSPLIDQEVIKFHGLEEFYQISAESKNYEYTVAWLDCVGSGKNFARGHFIRGDHSKTPSSKYKSGGLPLVVPFALPSFTLNKWSVTAFNTLYFNKQLAKEKKSTVHYNPFFYPLDAVKQWNLIYGPEGLLQFQCIIPPEVQKDGMKQVLNMVVASGEASFLAVLKEFGEIKSPGMLSFPRPGTTLCLDFSNSAKNRTLLLELDKLVAEFGGASYPAKDAVISKESFRQYYPNYQEFSKYIDPKFSSSLWRRVNE